MLYTWSPSLSPYKDRTKQNRTEQNRIEQNRTEQNRTEQNRTEQNVRMGQWGHHHPMVRIEKAAMDVRESSHPAREDIIKSKCVTEISSLLSSEVKWIGAHRLVACQQGSDIYCGMDDWRKKELQSWEPVPFQLTSNRKAPHVSHKRKPLSLQTRMKSSPSSHFQEKIDSLQFFCVLDIFIGLFVNLVGGWRGGCCHALLTCWEKTKICNQCELSFV